MHAMVSKGAGVVSRERGLHSRIGKSEQIAKVEEAGGKVSKRNLL